MLRRHLAFFFAGLGGLTLSLPIGILFDAFYQGPYVSWHNERYSELAMSEDLLGEPEERVVECLGEPSSIEYGWSERDADGYPTADADWTVVYNYAPYAFLPFARFQVRVVDERVSSLRTFAN